MPAPNSLCTVDDLKSDLAITATSTTEEERLLRLIDGVSDAIVSWCGRPFIVTTETAVELDGDGSDILHIKYPVVSIVSISNDGTTYTEGTHYELYSKIGQLVAIDGYLWATGRKKILITYTWGYEVNDLPRDVTMAARIACAKVYREFKEQRIGVTSTTDGGGQSISYEKGFTKEVRELLSPHRALMDERWAL